MYVHADSKKKLTKTCKEMFSDVECDTIFLVQNTVNSVNDQGASNT